MKIIKPQVLGLLTRPYEIGRRFRLGVAAIAFVPLGEAPVLLAETDMWPFLAEELPPGQALDAGIPKAGAEFVAIAHACAPGGVPVRQLGVGLQLGKRIKTLSVWGDREIIGDRASEPMPFTRMPIDWAGAYGGPDFADNPLGKGAAPIPGPDRKRFALPNVFDPSLAERARDTASGYAPLDVTWPARARFAGTHDEAWLKQDFPGFARDLDWRHFNIAPPDQALSGGLAGDESYACKNLHPEHPLLQGQLPAWHRDCFWSVATRRRTVSRKCRFR